MKRFISSSYFFLCVCVSRLFFLNFETAHNIMDTEIHIAFDLDDVIVFNDLMRFLNIPERASKKLAVVWRFIVSLVTEIAFKFYHINVQNPNDISFHTIQIDVENITNNILIFIRMQTSISMHILCTRLSILFLSHSCSCCWVQKLIGRHYALDNKFSDRFSLITPFMWTRTPTNSILLTIQALNMKAPPRNNDFDNIFKWIFLFHHKMYHKLTEARKLIWKQICTRLKKKNMNNKQVLLLSL